MRILPSLPRKALSPSTAVAPGGVHPLLEGVQLSGEGGESQGADEVGHPGRLEGVVKVQAAYAGHGAGAVGDAQALLAHQGVQGLDAGAGHGFAAGETLALIECLAPAQQHQAHMAERRKVAGGPQGAFLRDHRGHALVQHINQHFHQNRPHAAEALAQGVGPQDHHAADLLHGVRFAGGGTVAEDQIGGQLAAPLVRHRHRGKVAKAGGDAVGNPLFPGDFLRQGSGAGQSLPGGRIQLYRRAKTGHGYQRLQS